MTLAVIDLDSTANVAQILSVILPIFAGLYAWKRAVDRQYANQQQQIALMQQQLAFIEKQFGPNGGGLREAVNNLIKTVATIDARLIDLMKEHAELVGHVESCPVAVKRRTVN